MKLFHSTAKPSHYNQESAHYDALNEENSKIINRTIEKILKKNKVKTVLDLTCGTGSQVFWLTKRGYWVVGSDINARMLNIARDKAQQEGLNIKFFKGDMRALQVGQFDAVLTIFNAIGHLTKSDFATALQNIHRNLKSDGIYIFDIFNIDYLFHGNNITKLTVDDQTISGDTKARKIQYSTIDTDGILASYTISIEQKSCSKPKIVRNVQTLQVYSANQLKEMLEVNGFEVLEQCAIDGSKFDQFKTDRLLMIAKKCRL